MGDLKPCCANLENRGDPQPTNKQELTFTVCQVCGGRHFELNLDPIVVVPEGAAV